MKYATLCSGIGAPEVAAHRLGMEPVFCSEIEGTMRRKLNQGMESIFGTHILTTNQGGVELNTTATPLSVRPNTPSPHSSKKTSTPTWRMKDELDRRPNMLSPAGR